MDQAPAIRIGGVPITAISDLQTARTLSLLLWGDAGIGKTTLAATAPGRKLFVSFDLNGTASIRHMPDISVVDMSMEGRVVVEGFKSTDNPLNLKTALPLFDTVIIDSVTKAIELTLAQGIHVNKGATIERPSPAAYGVRNALTLELIRNVGRLCSRSGKHVIFIAHEDAPEKDDQGNTVKITTSLGGKLGSKIPADISEVWYMSEDGAGRKRIAVGQVRFRSPMKTRMFTVTPKRNEFTWSYDADRMTGMTLASWIASWESAGFVKIPLPA
jgi:hypothetical protein